MAVVEMPPPAAAVPIANTAFRPTTVASTIVTPSSSTAPLDAGIRQYVAAEQQPPSMLLSLQERKVPTAEEIAQKKLTFNLWFWGGGIVAPFLATIFYFGFRFWEK